VDLVVTFARAALIALGSLLTACSRPDAPASQAQQIEAPSTSAAAASSAEVPTGGVCPDPEAEHWDRWDDLDTGTTLYVAPQWAMPAPVAWEDCGSEGQLDTACVREAALPPSSHTHMFGAVVDVSFSGAGVGVFGRRCPGWDLILIAELQGRVLTALAQRRGPEARRVQVRDLAHGHWVATVRGGEAHTVLGGETGLGPPRNMSTVRDMADAITAYASGEFLVVQNRDLIRWNGERLAVPWDPSAAGVPTLWGQYALYTGWRKGSQVGLLWDAAGGERLAVQMRAAKVLRMATDGTDIAFVGQSGRREFLSAATFPGAGQAGSPREIMALPSSHGHPVVGCGLIAIRTGMQDISIARIADLRSWRVHSHAKCSLWCLDPLAVTCDELIAESYGPEWTMTRVRLDSLGPGERKAP
jgi:hypothetical protein